MGVIERVGGDLIYRKAFQSGIALQMLRASSDQERLIFLEKRETLQGKRMERNKC
jgi:hypothetical protein